jgi:hypothetical protein
MKTTIWGAAGLLLVVLGSGCGLRDRPGLLARFRARAAMGDCGYYDRWNAGGMCCDAPLVLPCSSPCGAVPGGIVPGAIAPGVELFPNGTMPPTIQPPTAPPDRAPPSPAGPSPGNGNSNKKEAGSSPSKPM